MLTSNMSVTSTGVSIESLRTQVQVKDNVIRELAEENNRLKLITAAKQRDVVCDAEKAKHIDKLEKTVKHLEEQHLKLAERNELLLTSFDLERKELTAKTEELLEIGEQEKKALLRQLEDVQETEPLQLENAQLRADSDVLSREVTRLKQEIRAFNTVNVGLKQESILLKQELSDAKAKLVVAHANEGSLDENAVMQNLTTRIANDGAAYAQVEVELNEANQKITQLNSHNGILAQEIEKEQAISIRLTQEIERLQKAATGQDLSHVDAAAIEKQLRAELEAKVQQELQKRELEMKVEQENEVSARVNARVAEVDQAVADMKTRFEKNSVALQQQCNELQEAKTALEAQNEEVLENSRELETRIREELNSQLQQRQQELQHEREKLSTQQVLLTDYARLNEELTSANKTWKSQCERLEKEEEERSRVLESQFIEKYEELQKQFETKSTSYQELEQRYEDLYSTYETLKGESQEIVDHLEKKEKESDEHKKNAQEFESQNTALMKKYEELEQSNQKVQTKLEGVLKTLQKKNENAETIQERDQQIKQLESDLRVKTQQTEKQQRRIESLEAQVIAMSQSFEAQQVNYESLQSESLKKVEQMKIDLLTQREESDKLKIEAEDAKRKVKLLRGEEQSMYQQLSEVEKDLQRIIADNDRLQNENRQLKLRGSDAGDDGSPGRANGGAEARVSTGSHTGNKSTPEEKRKSSSGKKIVPSRFNVPARASSTSARGQDSHFDSFRESTPKGNAEKGAQQQPGSDYKIVPVYGETLYKPCKGDDIDAKLSRWINRRKHNKILFSRTAPGKYIYGRLEVGVNISSSVRSENQTGHLIVTVSGADTRSGIEVCSIEDFVRRYESSEYEACEEQSNTPPAKQGLLDRVPSREHKYIKSPQKHVQRVLNAQNRQSQEGLVDDGLSPPGELTPAESTSTLPNNVVVIAEQQPENMGGHLSSSSYNDLVGSSARLSQGNMSANPRSFSNPPGWRSFPMLPGSRGQQQQVFQARQPVVPSVPSSYNLQQLRHAYSNNLLAQQQQSIPEDLAPSGVVGQQPQDASYLQEGDRVDLLTKSAAALGGMVSSVFGRNGKPKIATSGQNTDVYPPPVMPAVGSNYAPVNNNQVTLGSGRSSHPITLAPSGNTVASTLFMSKSKDLNDTNQQHILPLPLQLAGQMAGAVSENPNAPGTTNFLPDIPSLNPMGTTSGQPLPQFGARNFTGPTGGATAPIRQVSVPSPPSNSCSVPDESEPGDYMYHGGMPLQRARSTQRRSTRPKTVGGLHGNSVTSPAVSPQDEKMATTTINEDGTKITTMPLHFDTETLEGEAVYMPSANVMQQNRGAQQMQLGQHAQMPQQAHLPMPQQPQVQAQQTQMGQQHHPVRQQSVVHQQPAPSTVSLRPPNYVGNSPAANLQSVKIPTLFTFQGGQEFRSSLGAKTSFNFTTQGTAYRQ